MTVSSTTSAIGYTGTGTTASYGFTWAIAAAADLIVYTAAGPTTAYTKLTLTTDYTVTGVGTPTGGTITLTAGNLGNGSRLFIASDPAQVQALLLAQGAQANPADLMAGLDLLTREVQANRRLASVALQIPVAEALDGRTVTVPAPASRAGALLGFDAAGNLTTSALTQSILTFTTAATVALLKGLTPPANGTIYEVAGYNSSNDGGGGMFVWNSADTTADNGGTVIAANVGGTGRWNRIIDGARLSVRWFGAVGDGVTDDATAFQSCWTVANASTAAGVAILVPAGNYKLTASPGTITRNRVHIIGEGEYASRVLFNPGTTASLWHFENAVLGNSIYQSSVRSIAAISTNAVAKVAFDLVDIREFRIESCVVMDWTSTGADSVGLRTKGREFLIIDQLSIRADNCIQVKANPATADISADHFHWSNLYLTGAAASKALIAVDNDCSVFNWTLDGAQVWALGSYGLYWAGAGVATQVALNVRVENVRREQEQDNTAWVMYFDPSAGLRDLTLRNVHGGTTQNGYRIKSQRAILDHVFTDVGAGKTCLDIANVSRLCELHNCFWQTGATFTATGLTKIFAAYNPTDNTAGPSNALYRAASTTAGVFAYVEKFGDTREWYWQGDIAATGSVSIPASDNNSRLGALVHVAGYSATGPIKEAGYVADFPGAAVLISGTTNFAAANTAGKLCVFNAASTTTILNNTAQTLRVVVHVVWSQ